MASHDLGIIEEYAKRQPIYEAFTKSTSTLLETLVNSESIDFHVIEMRTKDARSLSEKITRDGKQGRYHALSDITDLSGVRIIAHIQSDCDKIGSLISSSFSVDTENSVRKEDELDADKFGYLSTHYVISLPQERIALAEFSRFGGLKCEIQVRTLLQHTWAALDWKLRYNEDEDKLPKELRRRLFRISALLEAADNEFSSVKKSIEELQSQRLKEISQNELDAPLDAEALHGYLVSSNTVQNVIEIARSAGLIVPSPASKLNNTVVRLERTAVFLELKTLKDIDLRLLAVMGELPHFFSEITANGQRLKNKEKGQLIATAVIRYALMLRGSASQNEQIFRKIPVSPTYQNAMRDYLSRRDL